MVSYVCAAKHMCVASHVLLTPMHKCRQCNDYMHVFCAGKSMTPPDDDAQNGLEYDCVLCCGGELLGRFNPPADCRNEGNDSDSCSNSSSVIVNSVPIPTQDHAKSTTTRQTSPKSSSLCHHQMFATRGPNQAVLPEDAVLATPTFSPVSCVLPCTQREWISVTQEVYDTNRLPELRTLAQQYPRLWKLVGKLFKKWKQCHWEHPKKYTNGTVFKQKVVRFIVRDRKYIEKNDMPAYDSAIFNNMYPHFEKVFYYPLKEFEDFAKDTWMLDVAKAEKDQDATFNDVLRLFGVALKSDNRDELNLLNTGKCYLRKDSDSPLGRTGSIFFRFSEQFNDSGIVISDPTRAVHLQTYPDINLNLPDRICIQRDHVWLSNLYLRNLKDYRRAMHKWKQGTGGGPGAPEHYADWNTRDDWTFSAYGGHKGDMLAYIYMLDKDAGFPLLEMYDDAPVSKTREDGEMPATPTNKRKRAGPHDTIKEVGENLCSTMTEGFGSMAKALEMLANSTSQPIPQEAAAYKEASTDLIHEIDNGLDTIKKIEDHIEDLTSKMNDSTAGDHRKDVLADMYSRRVNILTNTLTKAYKKLEDLMADTST